MLIVISGPAASGKTSVGEALAKRFPQSVYFSVDTIRHFVKGGFVEPKFGGPEVEKQMKLAEQITRLIVRRYLESNYVVIIDDVIGDEDVERYKNEFKNVYGFLLLPTEETLRQRDQSRKPEYQMGSLVEKHYKDFSNMDHSALKTIDSTNLTVEETVDQIFKLIKNYG
ncbi:MAG: AAA family ATPase [Patescibacteria group bacterium]|nr:AAA family ATPase [Patescibacteria group bacterium]